VRLGHSFSSIALFDQSVFDLTDAAGGGTVRMGGARVTGNFFSTLQVRPAMGRAIAEEDDQPGHARVAVIGDALWRARFAADPRVLERAIVLDGTTYRIIGMMPPEFVYPRRMEVPWGKDEIQRTEVWTPLALSAKARADQGTWGDGFAIGRLRPGVTVRQAQGEMSAIMSGLESRHPADERGWTALIRPLVDTVVGKIRAQLWMLFGAVAAVLLIACGNVASLLLTRATARTHEMGVRVALGAGAGRLVRQTITESMMLAGIGTAAGTLVAYGGIRVLLWLAPRDIPRLDETSIDSRVLGFALALWLAAALAFGVLPAIVMRRIEVAKLLALGGTRETGGAPLRLRRLLIAAEVGLSVVLLAGAGLLIRSYAKLEAAGTGFDTATMATRVWLPARYRTADQQRGFYRELLARLKTLTGVEDAGFVSSLPFGNTEGVGFIEVEGYANQKDQLVCGRQVTGGYFAAMGVPLVEGRMLDDRDRQGSPRVVLVNRAFVRQFLGGGAAVGRRLRSVGMYSTQDAWRPIVGVVGDVRDGKLEDAPRPTIYGPLWQADAPSGFIAVRARRSKASLVPEIRREMVQVEPALTVGAFQTMGELVSGAGARRRFQTLLLTVFAGVALALTLVGVYGLIAYSMRQRAREIGIRMALGATRAELMRMILMEGAGLSLAGLAIGLPAAWAMRQAIAGWLYGVAATDPVALGTASGLIVAASMAACAIPAWGASGAIPAVVLREN
jgi:putative ABC transport system permease protein